MRSRALPYVEDDATSISATRVRAQSGARVATNPTGLDSEHVAPMVASGRLSDELITFYRPQNLEADSFRNIRATLLARFAPGTPRALAVVSGESGDGRSYVAANLAVSFAQRAVHVQESVLLLDANLRNPRQHRIFNIPNDVGICAVLSGQATAAAAIHRVADIDALAVMPAEAMPCAPELLSGSAWPALLDALTQQFSIVIVDTAATTFGDYRAIVAKTKYAAMVVRKNKSGFQPAQELVANLHAEGAMLTGCIFNEAKMHKSRPVRTGRQWLLRQLRRLRRRETAQ